MLLNKKIFFLLLLINTLLSNPIFNSSLNEKYKLADTYYESDLYDDAIIIYEEIFGIQKSLLNIPNSYLLETIQKIYNLYFMKNDFDNAKKYLQEYINIQASDIIQLQKNYIQPLNDLKKIYISEKEAEFVFRIDSLLSIIDTNMDWFKNDSLFTLPNLIINTNPDYETDTEYSINDYALEKMNEGFDYLYNNEYSDAITNFNSSLQLNAKVLDVNYFETTDFSEKKDTLYQIILNDVTNDSTKIFSYFYLGLFDYLEENYINAKKYFTEYSELNAEDINPIIFLGKINFLESNWLDAIFYFYRALKIDPNNLDANLYIAKSLIQIEDYHEAIKTLKYILKHNKDNYDLIFSLGLSYYSIQDYENAIKYFTESLLLNSEDYNTYYYLGLSYAALDSNKKALDAYKKCIDTNPNFSLAQYEIGKIYQLILDDENAIKYYKSARRSTSFDDLNYRLGMLYYKNESFLKAMDPIKDYILNNLEDFQTLEILGDIFIKVKRYAESIDVYSRLINYDENNEIYYLNIANSYYKLNNFEESTIYYKKVVELDDTNYEILSKIGQILNKQNLFDDAQVYLNKALECGPPNKNLLVQLGQSYAGQKKFLQSMLTFKEALQFSLEDPIIHYQLAIIYKELHMYDLAINNFLFFIESNKDDEITYFLIGECYFELEDYKNAIKYFNKSYRINYSIKSLFKIGRCYDKSGDIKNAIKYFKNVIKKNPDHVKARIQLIKIYEKSNRTKDILRECEIIYMLDRSAYNSLTSCIQPLPNGKK